MAATDETLVNVNDSLYSHSNDGNQSLRITPALSGAENYAPWRRQMELALSARKKLGYVTGAVTKPESDSAKIEAWTAGNHQVISWMLQNMSERIKLAVMYTETAKDIWDT